MLRCDKCSAAIAEGSKFCPQCGDPVTDADMVSSPGTRDQIAQVDLSFGYSSSPNYETAISICRNIPTYEVSGEGKDAQHRILLPITEVDLIENLFGLVGNWKSSRMLINGRASSKKHLTYYGVGCYRERRKSYNPAQYCFGEREFEANVWGCKRLNMPLFSWGGGWLEYGRFDRKGVWHFDKARIRHELERGIAENELCPVLNPAAVLETLERIPDSIDPRKDPNWEFRTNYEEVRGQYKEVATGIRPVVSRAGTFVVGGFEPRWEADSEAGHDATGDTGPLAFERPQVPPARSDSSLLQGVSSFFRRVFSRK